MDPDTDPTTSEDAATITAQALNALQAGTGPSLAPAWRLTDAQLQHLHAIKRNSESPHTKRSYAAAHRYWQLWHRLRFDTELTLPVDAAAVMHFILDHFATEHDPSSRTLTYLLPEWIDEQLRIAKVKRGKGPLQPATIEQRVSALSQLHEQSRDAAGAPVTNPCRDPYVKKLLWLVRKAYQRSTSQGHAQDTGDANSHSPTARASKRSAATLDVLEKMLTHCSTDSLRDARDRAVLLVGFNSGGRRRSEIVSMQHEDLIPDPLDASNYIWNLRWTKTGPVSPKPIQDAAAAELRNWIARSGRTSGPVFWEIDVHGHITDRPMSDQAIYRLIKRLAELAGVPGAWGGHSLRAGFITQAGAERHSLGETMDLSGHTSVQTAIGYYRAGQASTSPVANLARGISKPPITPETAIKRRRRYKHQQ